MGDVKWNPSDIGGRGNLFDMCCTLQGSFNIFIRPGCELERPDPLQPSSHHRSCILPLTLPVMNINSSSGMARSTQHGDLKEVVGAPFLGFVVGSV